MRSIRLLHNKWFVAFALLVFSGILWGSFQWVYGEQILLQRLYKGLTAPDEGVALAFYRRMMESGTTQKNAESLSLVAEVLVKAGRRDEAIKIWEHLVAQAPDDRKARLRLAVALHNQGKYLEAEKHFDVLLREADGHE